MTIPNRLVMVTVMVKGTFYVIVDICLRMLKPVELYKAQGFPASYIITHGADGKPFTVTQQVHMCGNSVSPPPMAAQAGPTTRGAPKNAKHARLKDQQEPGGMPSLLKSFRRSRSSSVECAGVSCSGSFFFSSVIAMSSGW